MFVNGGKPNKEQINSNQIIERFFHDKILFQDFKQILHTTQEGLFELPKTLIIV